MKIPIFQTVNFVYIPLRIFATNSNVLNPILFQPDCVILGYFKLNIIIIWINIVESVKKLRSTLGCKDIGIRKSEFVTKTQFLKKRRKICFGWIHNMLIQYF